LEHHEVLRYLFPLEKAMSRDVQEAIMANVNNMRRKFQFAAWVIGLAMGVNGLSLAAPTDLSSAPLQTTTTAAVLPNVMFMLDDSGSMDWDYLPDVAKDFAGNYGFNSSHCNGVYFNPNITYTPPVTSTGATINAATPTTFIAAYKNGYNTAAGTVNLNSGFTGGSGSGSSGYTSYSGPAFFYDYSGTQTTGVQMNYFNTSSTFYNECNSSIGSAPGNAVFTQTILSSALPTAIITIPGNIAKITVSAPGSGATNSTVTGITVGGVQILSGTTLSSRSATTVAGFIATNINNCTTTQHSSPYCTTVGGTGYSATVGAGASANIVTISGSGGLILISSTGNLTETVTTLFPVLVATQITGITVGGLPLMSAATVSTTNNITLAASLAANISSYGYCTATVGTGTSVNVVTLVCPYAASALPGLVTTSPAQGGSGVVVVPNTLFSQASSPAQLQNFANWYSYYSNRMMMMKTGVGLAFSPITANYRIGFMTMNNNISPDIVDIAPFNAAQKSLWYTKLYASTPGNMTPLREALSHVGQLYAHKFGSITTYHATITVGGSGATAVDSIQVNGVETFPLDTSSNPISTPLETTTSALAADIANQINAPLQTQFGASASGNVVTVVGPASALGSTPIITDIGAMTETVTAFTATTTTAQLNGITPLDPMQYSCQQNFVILSTDGYWNGPNTYDLNNNPVGQRDGVEPRPMNDGGTSASQTTTQVLQSTSQVQQTTQQVQSYTTNLQSTVYPLLSSTAYYQNTTVNLQAATAPLNQSAYTLQAATAPLNQSAYTLQAATAPLTQSAYTLQAATAPLTQSAYTLQAATAQLQQAVSGDGGSTWSSWSNTSSCTWATTATGFATITVTGSSSSPVSSITVGGVTITSGAYSGSSNNNTEALNLAGKITVAGWSATFASNVITIKGPASAVGATVVVNKSSGSDTFTIAYTGQTKCQYGTLVGPASVGSCTYNVSSGTSGTWSPKVICSYSASPTVTNNVSSCAAATAAGSATNGSAWTAATTCSYGTLVGPASVGSCTYNVSSGTSGTWSPKVICSYSASPTVTNNVSSCAAATASGSATNGSAWTAATTCSYGTLVGPASVGSCTYNVNSGTSGTWSPKVICSYSASPTVTNNVSSCAAAAASGSATNGSAWTAATTCSYGTLSSAAPVSSCTYNVSSGTGTWSPKVICSFGGSTVTPVTSCTPVAASGTTTNGSAWIPATTCGYSAYSIPVPVSSCTYQNKSASSPYATAVTCSYGAATVTTATTCSTIPQSISTTNGAVWAANATSCGYTTGSWINTTSPPCTLVGQSTGPNYTVATAITNCQTTSTTVGVLSCSPSVSGGTTITCPGFVTTGPTAVASCTNISPSSGNNYMTTTCNTQVASTNVLSCTPATASSSNNWTTTACNAASGGIPNTLADVAEYYYATDLRDGPLGNCTGAVVSPATVGNDVCLDNVPTTSLDSQHQQHMTTFTLGLGARGRMVSPTPPATPYQNLTSSCNPATDGDFCAIYSNLTGATANGSTICSWQASGTICNWPVPNSGSSTNVDDLWHAAVNGRGIYFSATDPTSLSAGLSSALAGIQSRLGAASASATSSPNLTQSNNFIFSATYLTTMWDGEVTSRTIDPITGNVSTTILWSAQTQLDSKVHGDTSSDKSVRKIYMFDSANASGNNLKPFLYGSLTPGEKLYFDNLCNTTYLSQCTVTNLSVAQIASGNSGSNLIDYLRGSQSLETPIEVFRPRIHFLGDTVNAKPLYVKFPVYSFIDAVSPSYSAFKSTQTTLPRQGVLYVGSNDGMLHAFNADTGVEMWAYVPKIVMPNLYKLADVNYATQHQYYVDGSPATMDIYVATATNGLTAGWHTILAGGLGLGGQGFYALDVTDPANPQALWEICSSSTLCAISDADMGYSYGEPVITKRSTDGKWVVLLSSGYNNAGSGKGTLFELDAVTGAVLHKTTTDTTATNPPSGLAKLSPWIDSINTDFTARYVYGGDLNGNVWRFDLGVVAGPDLAPTVTKIASLVDGSGAPQSVTTRPELSSPLNNVSNYTQLGTGKPVIFVTTGRYLGTTDLSNLQVQSVYGIEDDLSKTGAAAYYGNPRTYQAGLPGKFVKQYIYQPAASTRTTSTNIITAGCGLTCGPQYAVNWTSNSGWYADFVVNDSSNNPISPSVSPGERVNINPQLVNGTLIVVTNVPYASACTAGGSSWLYSFNFLTGTSVHATTVVGQLLVNGTALSAGFTVVRLSSGELRALITDATGNVTPATPATSGAGATQQTSWRELTQ
jgi:type IV pilus assembly protein PilY1